VPDPVDLDGDADELAGLESPPGAVRPQRQGDALGRQPLGSEDLGAALSPHEQGVDLLEIAVDPMRAGEGVEKPELRALRGERHDGEQRNIKCRHVNWRPITQW
jgi:hypothetical protein